MTSSPPPTPPPPPYTPTTLLPVLITGNVPFFWVGPLVVVALAVICMAIAQFPTTCDMFRSCFYRGETEKLIDKIPYLVKQKYGASPPSAVIDFQSKAMRLKAAGHWLLLFASLFNFIYAIALNQFPKKYDPDTYSGSDSYADAARGTIGTLNWTMLVCAVFYVPGFMLLDLGWASLPSTMMSLGDVDHDATIEQSTNVFSLKKADDTTIKNRVQSLLVTKYYHSDIRTQVQFSIFIFIAYMVRRDILMQAVCWLIFSTGITLSYARSFTFYFTMDTTNFAVDWTLAYLLLATLAWLIEWFGLVIIFNVQWEDKASIAAYGTFAEYPVDDDVAPSSADAAGELKSFTNTRSIRDLATVLLAIAQACKFAAYTFAVVYGVRLNNKNEDPDQKDALVDINAKGRRTDNQRLLTAA